MKRIWHNPDDPGAGDFDHESESLRQLARVFQDHGPAEPAADVWEQTLARIQAQLPPAKAEPRRWPLQLMAGIVAAAALIGTIVLARSLWPTTPAKPSFAELEEVFPVVGPGEINILSMDARDAGRIVLGEPLLESIDFASPNDIEIVLLEPDPDEGHMPRIDRTAGVPMIFARGDGK